MNNLHHGIARPNGFAYRYGASTPADIQAVLANNSRDPRIVFFLGIANWFIFLDHIPGNAVSGITIRNFGFSGAAEWFIFIAGYSAATVYAKMMLDRGFVVGASRLFKRVWQLYIAYVVLFVIYIVVIADVARQYGATDIIDQFNIAGLVDHPIRTLAHGLRLQAQPLNLDVLQLYIALMAFAAPVLWAMLRKPNLTMAGSLALYLVARRLEWNLPSFPAGNWYFNPFCWQLLFVFGARLALGATSARTVFSRMPGLVYFSAGYLVFAFLMTMAVRFAEIADLVPAWLFGIFNPNDKTNLAPYRVVHFMVLLFIVTQFISRDWRGLRWRLFQPVLKCGEQSLAVFCVGVFLSFAGHLALMINSDSLQMQICVSTAGIGIMTLVAYYISWSRQQDASH